MDRIVELVVRVVSALAGWARVLPGLGYAGYEPGRACKVLLVGYNGARNIGSDVRVATIAKQIEQLLGRENVEISVMTLDATSTAPYFDSHVRQIQFSTLFFGDLLEACSHHHVAILCEGSTFKSTFANALTLYSCEAAGVMRAQGKPCIAYGCEVGAMDPSLVRAVQSLCTNVRFATRSAGSLAALQDLGFTGFPGTDTAWNFDSSSAHEEALAFLREKGWDGNRPLLGIVPINPFCWPVKPSLRKLVRTIATGDHSRQFQAWYFFSSSEERDRAFHTYLDALANACSTFAAEQGFQPVIVGMEKLDAEACFLLTGRLAETTPVFISDEFNGFVIAEVLRSLSLLVTSRYHAEVLAARAFVPTVAVSMDERLDNLAEDLGTDLQLLLHVDDPDLAPRILLALDYAHENAGAIRSRLTEATKDASDTFDQMGKWLVGQLKTISNDSYVLHPHPRNEQPRSRG